jgi:hypothetical protein
MLRVEFPMLNPHLSDAFAISVRPEEKSLKSPRKAAPVQRRIQHPKFKTIQKSKPVSGSEPIKPTKPIQTI